MEYLRQPWAHQLEAIERAKNLPCFFLALDPGTGKTSTVINILRHQFITHGRLLRVFVIAPPITLDNWRSEFLMNSRIPGSQITVLSGSGKHRAELFAKKAVEPGHIFISNYEAMNMKDLYEAIQKWKPEALVFDECFHGDTEIITRGGNKRIADIVPGDEVLNCLGWSGVISVNEKKVSGCMAIKYNDSIVYCTKNHPFFTDKGWVMAGDLKKGDLLASTEQTMRLVQTGIHSIHCPEQRALLQILLKELRNEGSGAGPRIPGLHSQQKPNVQEGHSREGFQDVKKNWAQTSCARRKWYRKDESRKGFVGRSWERMEIQLCGFFGKAYSGISNKLQDRYSERENKTWRGGRWIQPFCRLAARAGSEKGKKADFFRVEDIEILEQGGHGKQGEMSFFDLEVGGHPSFTVNGALVHNCHRLANHSSKRSKLADGLANPGTKKKPLPRPLVYCLSGTPVMNNAMDLFSQYKVLDGGETFGQSFYEFRGRYFRDKNAGMPKQKHFPNWVPIPGSAEIIAEKMKKNSMRVKKEECLDLPPLVETTIAVEMTAEQRKIYKEMFQDFVAFFERDGDNHAVVATMAMTKGLRLMQIASGFVKTDTGEELAANDGWTPKQYALYELLKDLVEHKKVIIWAVWKYNYVQIREVCERLKIQCLELNGDVGPKKNRENAALFESSEEYRVVIAHPESAGEGLNLISASEMISYSRDFSWRRWEQCSARNYRGGSNIHDRVTRYVLVAKDTIEERITRILMDKKEISDAVLREITLKVDKS